MTFYPLTTLLPHEYIYFNDSFKIKSDQYLVEDCDSHLEGDPGDDGGVEEQVEYHHVLTKALLGQLRLVQVVLKRKVRNGLLMLGSLGNNKNI